MNKGFNKKKIYDINSSWLRAIGDVAMDAWDVFTGEQKEILFKNGQKENHGKNHVPAAYLRVRSLGYSFLITELDPEQPEMAFGLCDYDTELKIGFVNLKKLAIEVQTEDIITSKKYFLSTYNLAVYAMIADNIGTIVVGDNPEGYKDEFDKFATEQNCDPNQNLKSLNVKFPLRL